jgi:hypothetical protein
LHEKLQAFNTTLDSCAMWRVELERKSILDLLAKIYDKALLNDLVSDI